MAIDYHFGEITNVMPMALQRALLMIRIAFIMKRAPWDSTRA
jgi:hypothetical protein